MLKKCWDHLEETLLIAAFMVTVPLLGAQVFSRYVLNSPLSWSEELARYIFVWQIWLGSSYCVQKGRHIRIDVFTHKLPEKFRKIYDSAVYVVCIAFCGFLVYKGCSVVSMLSRLGQTSPALHLSMSVVYLSIPVCNVLMIARYVELLIKTFKKPAADGEKEV